MIAVRIHDDTPGYKETFWKGPFESEDQAQEICDRFNAERENTNWWAGVYDLKAMPSQMDWEKKLYSEYGGVPE